MRRTLSLVVFILLAVSLAFAQQDSVKVRSKKADNVTDVDRLVVQGGADVAFVDLREANLRLSAQGSAAATAFGSRALDFVGNFNQTDRTMRVENRIAGSAIDSHRLAFVDQATAAELMALLRSGQLGIGTPTPFGKLEIREDLGLTLATMNNANPGSPSLLTVTGVLFNEGATLGGAVARVNSAATGFPGGPNAFHVINFTAGPMLLWTSNAERVRITATGDVGIGTSTPAAKLDVIGTFQATTKNFSIDHPTKAGMKLVHACIEGPENAVYYRGEATLSSGSCVVTLPDYFEKLTAATGRTVQLTCKDDWSPLSASAVQDGKFTAKTTLVGNQSQAFFWEVKAVRADVANLTVEVGKPAADAGSGKLETEIQKLKK